MTRIVRVIDYKRRPPSRLRIEHSVIDLSALPRRRTDEASNDIMWGYLYLPPGDWDLVKPLVDLRYISRPGCRYVIASRMYRTAPCTGQQPKPQPRQLRPQPPEGGL